MRFLSWDLTEPNKETAAALETAGVSPLVAAVLAARGFRTPEEAEDFLSRELSRLEDPFMLRDMDLAVSRIKTAMEAGEKIAVYGD
jgi:single-stranded-DNA-specific exonuclease